MIEKKVASTTLRNKIIKTISNMQMAERNGNLKKAQSEYEKLENICEKNNMDFQDTLKKGKEALRKTSVNPYGLRY